MNQKTVHPGTARDRKRARFQPKPSEKPHRRSPVVFVLGAALVLLVAVGMALALGKTPVADTGLAGPSAATGQSSQPSSPSVKAATVGHAPYPVVQAENGAVRLPLATFDDGKAHYYTYVHNGKPVEFFILKSADGTVRAAFNACDVCYPYRKGYRQEGDEVVCNNCGRRFPANQINVVQGGCNPAPLDRSVDSDTLLIRAEDLAAGVKYF